MQKSNSNRLIRLLVDQIIGGFVKGFVKTIKYFNNKTSGYCRNFVYGEHPLKAESARASIPTVRLQPKSAEFRYKYRCLETFLMTQQIEQLGIATVVQLLVLKPSRTSTAASSSRKILCIAATALCMISLQDRINTKRVRTFYPTQNMQICDDDMFIKMFRFRREHLHEMLQALNLDSSKSILHCRQGRAQYFLADLCLMIVLRRMEFPCRFVDLVNVFGLPSHRLCDIFHSTIDVYTRDMHANLTS